MKELSDKERKFHEKELSDFNRTLELRPDNPATLINRAKTYVILGRYDEALADLNRCLERLALPLQNLAPKSGQNS